MNYSIRPNFWLQRRITRSAEQIPFSRFLHEDGTVNSSVIKLTEWFRSLCEENEVRSIEFGLSKFYGDFERYVYRLRPLAKVSLNLRLPDEVVCFVFDDGLKHYIVIKDDL